MTSALTQADVAHLMAEPSPYRRAEIADKLAREIDSTDLTENELKLVQEIIALMARDVEAQVRQALAQNLQHAKRLPHDTALRLANDIEKVALPILGYSPVLSDQDLIKIVKNSASAKQEAIAGRPHVSETLSEALITNASDKAVAALMKNATAHINDLSMNKAIDRFGANDAVKESMIKRQKLPLAVTERLVALVSSQLQDYLVSHHELSPATAADIMMQSRERSTINLSFGATELEIEKLVAQMHAHQRLTPSLVMRALCMGDITFFEAAIAMLANIPVINASILMHNAGLVGLKSLYDKSGLPPNLFLAVRIAVDVIHETPLDGGLNDRERYRTKVLERILTHHEGINPEDLDYLVNKLQDVKAVTDTRSA